MSVVAVAPSVVAGTAADDTVVIKNSCILRAKFEKEKEVFLKQIQTSKLQIETLDRELKSLSFYRISLSFR